MISEKQLFVSIFGLIAASLFLVIIPLSLFRTLRFKNKALLPTGDPSRSILHITALPNWIDLLVIMSIFAVLTPAIPDGSVSKEESVQSIDSFLLLSNLLGQVFVTGFIVLLVFWRVRLTDYFGLSLRKLRWKDLIWAPAILLTIWMSTALIFGIGYFDLIERLFGENPLQEAVLLLQQSTDPVLLTLLVATACIGAPISEEFFFRGYLYPVIKRLSSPWIAILLSSALFSVIHFNLAALPSLFLMGVLLALAYEKTKSIWIPILVHFLFNSATVFTQIISRYFPETSL